jgi:hypothetical protein
LIHRFVVRVCPGVKICMTSCAAIRWPAADCAQLHVPDRSASGRLRAGDALVSGSPSCAALDGSRDTLAGHRPLMIADFEALLRAERSLPLCMALAEHLDVFRTALTGGIQGLLARRSESASRDPRVAASLVMATFDGLIIQWLLAPEQVRNGRLIADTLKRIAIRAAVSSESIDAV